MGMKKEGGGGLRLRGSGAWSVGIKYVGENGSHNWELEFVGETKLILRESRYFVTALTG